FFVKDFLAIWKMFFLFDLNVIINLSPILGIEKLIRYVIYVTLIIGIPLILTILFTQMAVGGINFAPKAIQFKGKKINP
mgnify:CR=1